MSNALARIEADIEAGRASAESLVQLFDAASEAEQRADSEALARACAIAKWLSEVLCNGLAADALRLLELCNRLLLRTQAGTTVSTFVCD